MSVISFQGLCYFEKVGGRVVVHLPAADWHARHQDGTRAKPHHAAIFVRDAIAIEPDGFSPCLFDPDDGIAPPVKGWYFPLSRFGPPENFSVRLSDQGRSLSAKGLHKKLVSFKKIDPTGSLRPLPGRAAGTVIIEGGSFEFHPGTDKKLEWEVDSTQLAAAPADLGRPAWRVDWHTGAPTGTAVRLSVEHPIEGEVASIRFMAGNSQPNEIVIGNVDERNPGQWPTRRPMKREKCEDVDGDLKPHGLCYDNDFKWFYRLFDEGVVGRILRGYARLPVPRLKSGREADSEEDAALDTPTCFPGTD